MPGMSPHMKIKKGRPLDNWPGGNTDPLINIDTFTAAPVQNVEDVNGFTGSASDAEQGDLSYAIEWFIRTVVASPATAGVQNVDVGGRGGGDATGLALDTAGDATAEINGDPAGTVVPAIATQNWDVNVTIDGNEVAQELVIAVNIADDYDDITALLDAQVAGGTFTFVNGDFVLTSDTTGVSSAATIGTGTAGNGDLFAAITAATGQAITFSAPTPGTTTVYTATITIDGNAPTAIAITGDAAQTFGDLVTELSADTNAAGANWSLGVADDLLAESQTAGSNSTILIADTNLFSSLNNFAQIDAAVDGVDEVVELTEVGGIGAAPALTFTTLGVQDVVASITDGFNVTVTDTQAINVSSP